jgi:hypothetical protein
MYRDGWIILKWNIVFGVCMMINELDMVKNNFLVQVMKTHCLQLQTKHFQN